MSAWAVYGLVDDSGRVVNAFRVKGDNARSALEAIGAAELLDRLRAVRLLGGLDEQTARHCAGLLSGQWKQRGRDRAITVLPAGRIYPTATSAAIALGIGRGTLYQRLQIVGSMAVVVTTDGNGCERDSAA
jgi:hypothetical protein